MVLANPTHTVLANPIDPEVRHFCVLEIVSHTCSVGQSHIHAVYIRVFFAYIPSIKRSYTAQMYGSGRPYTVAKRALRPDLCITGCVIKETLGIY